MKWYLGLNEQSAPRFRDLLRVAIRSAAIHTQLRPHMLYDGGESEFTREMRAAGVTVIFNRISFYDQLETTRARRFPHWEHYMDTAGGAFQRLDIPKVETEDQFVLYTDCDVMFTGPVNVGRYRPSIFMGGPEFNHNSHGDRELNSGVMVINVERLGRDAPAIVDHGCDLVPGSHLGYDQEFLIQFYRGAWDPLPTRYNWKPYWGVDSDARIVHWHGPKPDMARGILYDEGYQTSDYFRGIVTGNRASYEDHLRMWDGYASTSSPASSTIV